METTTKFKILSFILILHIASILQAQKIQVSSFKPLPNDMTARIDAPMTDQNGEVCAIIKVETNQTGFVWEGDGLGIVDAPRKTGEYWLYVPRGAQRLTIKHDQLGILRNYQYPVPIESASVYEMKLVTGEVELVVRDREVITQWLVIDTDPEGANVFIDDQMAGTTPLQRKYPEGAYNYRIEMPRYHNEAGRVELKDERKILDLALRPRFGNIQVTSAPESGMMIFVDGENTGQTTPATIEEISSGQRQVRLQSQWYQPQTQNITVSDNQTTTAAFTMQPAFANITIRTEPRAEILIDGSSVATGTHTTRMLAGVYTISAQLDKHDPDRKQITVEAGSEQEVTLQLRPQTGTLDIATVPFNARITLNGENRGTTPTTLRNLLVGDYNLTLSMDGYGTVNKTITIREGETTEVNETLPSGKEITIASTPSGAQLTISGNPVGTTPWSGTLAFGRHDVKLVNQTKVVEETINVTQEEQEEWEFDVRESWFDERSQTMVVEVYNPATGKTWMDRNLGADQTANSSTDEKAYGDLYQWGRGPDGHQKRNSSTTNTRSSSNTPGHGDFITVNTSPYDWRSPRNDNLWQGVNGTNNPCPAGYRLPTATEWKEERRSWNSNNASGAFASPLKLPVAGYRDNSIGSLVNVGSFGNYWSSTVSGTYARDLYFDSSNASMFSDFRALGFSVRCLKD